MTTGQNAVAEYDTFVGIDVDKKSFSITIKEQGILKRSVRMPANYQQLYNYIMKHCSDKKILCVYEAGPTGYSLYDFLVLKFQECVVVAPNSIPRARNEIVKNNRLDSMKLSETLSAGQIKSIRVPVGEYRELRNLVRALELYTRKRTIAKQRIKGLLLHNNLHEYVTDPDSKWSSKFINSLKEISCSYAVRVRLDLLLDDYHYSKQKLLIIHRHLRKFIKQYPDLSNNMKYATSLPGIGFIVAVSFLAISGDPKNLLKPEEVSSFVGLTPVEHSTGDTEKRGSISHRGPKRLRKLFIEAAWIAIRCDTELRMFYQKIVSKNHPKCAKQKAIVAVARKLTERLYRVLKEQRQYKIF